MEDTIRKLYVEASSRCNLNCRMCFRHSWVDEGFGDLEAELFFRLMDDPALEGTETVFFGGMGEPLVHPDVTAMVRRAAERGKRTELITNGTLLTKERVEALLAAGIRKIWVSIDEIYENYAKIQVGSSFELVRGHLEQFNALRHGSGVELGMTAVIMRDNIQNLDRIRDFALRFEADDLNLSHMIPNRAEDLPHTLWSMCDVAAPPVRHYYEVPDWSREFPMFRFRKRDLEELFGGDRQKSLEAELFSWKGRPMTRRVNYCRFIEEGNCFIRWDGDVSPCMGLLHSADSYLGSHKRRIWHHAFGNAREQSLSEIWDSAEYRSFRERVHAFDFAPCLYCGECRQLEENREDCIGAPAPTCGGCLWGQGFIVCP